MTSFFLFQAILAKILEGSSDPRLGDLVPDNLKASLDRWLDEQLHLVSAAAKQQMERKKLADQQRAAMMPGLLGQGQMGIPRPGMQWHHPGVQQPGSNGMVRSQQSPVAALNFVQMMANGGPQEAPFDLKVSMKF